MKELTNRQLEILKLLNKGLTIPEIARKLEIAENTAVRHKASLYDRLQAHTKEAAIKAGKKLKLIN